MSKYYKREVRHVFKVDRVLFAIMDRTKDETWNIEELRKNGHEDTHFYGTVSKVGGHWKLLDGREHLAEYFGEDMPEKLETYLERHKPPAGDIRTDSNG